MAGDLLQFVDSNGASPTVRLDLNDEVTFWTKAFTANPPRLRRSQSENSMRDGIFVGSASYSSRTLTIEIQCRKTTQDLAAVEMQKLWRELDRPDNWMRYQPNGLTKPVFFRTYRSDATQIEDVMAQAAMRTFSVEVLAEPFALGLKETLGPYAVNNDPGHATNGCHFTTGTILGDVPASAVVVLADSGASALGTFAIAQRLDATATNLYYVQAESMGLGTNTSNPGGGPDATMSGTGTNNYVSTSFGTATMSTRLLTSSLTVRRGRYRLIACVKRSDASSGMSVRAKVDASTGDPIELPLSTTRMLVDLGPFDVRGGWNYYDDYGYAASTSDPGTSTPAIELAAARSSGSGTLAWDYLLLAPAEVSTSAIMSSDIAVVMDGPRGQVTQYGVGGLVAQPIAFTGSTPLLWPGATNRFTLVRGLDPAYSTAKTLVTNISLYYWPAYLHVRPVSS